jgi:hypothetical protein
MLEGNLHTWLLQARLNPNLTAYSALTKQEVDREMDMLISDRKDPCTCEAWSVGTNSVTFYR